VTSGERASAPRPERALAGFCRVLRELGVPVSTAELLDATRALCHVDPLDRGAFRAALAATLVKSGDHLPAFEAAFSRYFVRPEVRQERLERRRRLRRRVEEGMRRSEELSFQGMPLELNDSERVIYAMMDEEERERLVDFLDRSSEGLNVEARHMPLIESIVRRHLARRRADAGGEGVGAPVDVTGLEELDEVIEGAGTDLGAEGVGLLFADLGNVDEGDVPRLTRIIRLLSRRLATRISRRYRAGRKRKEIDIRRTIRRNVAYGGVPFRLRYRARTVRKPKLVLICDVSGSMARYTEFILQFIYGLTSVVDRIESFVFAEGLERITQHFQQRRPFEDTMPNVVDSSKQWGKGTNLGDALDEFIASHRRLLTPDTFVIVVSDGRTLAPSRAAARLERMRRLAKDVLWLNTLPEARWDEVGAVSELRPHCRMVECCTLAHLERVIKGHVLTA